MSKHPARKLEPARRLDGVRKSALETSRNRLLVTGAVLTIAFAVIVGRLVDLTVFKGAEPPVAGDTSAAGQFVERGNIVDRNGLILATSLPTVSLYADPRGVLDADETAAKLIGVLSDLDRAETLVKLRSKGRFVWLARNLTPQQHYRINRLGLPGIGFQRSERRVYPHGRLVSHVLGITDVDGRGLTGVERQFDRTLRAGGDPLRLSIDLRIQSLLREELAGAVGEFRAIGGAALVLDVNTGEIVAMVSLPDFDPNTPSRIGGEAGFNRATKGVYEMGSTFKLFTAAMALDSGAVDLRGGYDASKPIRVARFTINDFHAKNRWLSIPEIIVYSSNIGAAKMAMDVGTERQRAYLDRFGLLTPTAVELPEVGAPLTPTTWRPVNTMTISYGHGIAVSPLQLASGVATLVNGGIHRPATLIFRNGLPVAGKQAVSRQTSAQMRGLMRLVVDRGTGRKADTPGYLVGGKTGTADKQSGSGYSDNDKISSFVGVFPIDDPRYLVLVLVDEPVGNERTFNYATGGWVAAPVVGRVVERMAPMVGIAPDLDAEFATPVLPNIGKKAQASKQATARSDLRVPAMRQHRTTALAPVVKAKADAAKAAEENLILRTRQALAGALQIHGDRARVLKAVRAALEPELAAQ